MVKDGKRIDISDRVMLININQKYQEGMTLAEVLEAVHASWLVGERRNEAEYALATFQGEVKGVFVIDYWYSEQGLDNKKRWAFKGKMAPIEIENKYIDGCIRHYFKKGSRYPIRYINC